MTTRRLASWLLPALLALLAGCGTVRNTIADGDDRAVMLRVNYPVAVPSKLVAIGMNLFRITPA